MGPQTTLNYQSRLTYTLTLKAFLLIILIEFLFKIIIKSFEAGSQRFIILINIPFQLLMLSISLIALLSAGVKVGEVGMRREQSGNILKTGLYFYILLFPLFATSGLVSSLLCRYLNLPPHSRIIEVLLKEKSPANLALITLQATILAPFAEELFFRGIIYNSFKKNGRRQAIILSSLIFSLFHREVFSLLPVFILGLYLAFLYERYKNILYPIFLHGLHNTFILLLAFGLRSNIDRLPLPK